MRQKLSNNLKLGIIGDTGDTSPHPSLVPIECDPIEKIDPLSICWWCDEAMGRVALHLVMVVSTRSWRMMEVTRLRSMARRWEVLRPSLKPPLR